MKANLEKLFPKETKIKFSKIDKEFTVMPITLSDDAWMLHEFGGQQGLVDVFEKHDLRGMVRILYRLLSNDDKKFITTNIEINFTDEEGQETSLKSNIDKLLYMIDVSEMSEIVTALLNARGKSLPDLAEDASSDEVKKKVMKSKK